MVILWASTIVFLMNLVPAFAPPTWTFLSYVQVIYDTDLIWLAIFGAFSATVGRLLLSRLSTIYIRNKLLTERTISNIDYLKDFIQKKRTWSMSLVLFYAFSPFPSNQLFIAYGLTGLPLRLIGLPYFLGRLLSYTFWVFTASQADKRLDASIFGNNYFLGIYFVLAQFFTLFTIYLFTRIDWKAVIMRKHFALTKHE